MFRSLLIPLLIALVAAVSAAGWLAVRNSNLKADIDQLENTIQTLEATADAKELARRIAQEEANRFKAVADEYTQLRESLLRETDPNDLETPLPDWLRTYIERLLDPRRGVPDAGD